MTRAHRITTLAENGPPPAAAATLYRGEVMHQRLKPFGHRFCYSMFQIAFDVDRLGEVAALSPLLSVNGANVFTFYEKDHAPEGGTIREHADRLLAGEGLEQAAERILLLTCPRMFGYVFNPLSVYFAYGHDGRLLALIYEVRNTFGERHSYVAPVRPGELSAAGLRQSRKKAFHVSPFISMDARYGFSVLPPGDTVRLRINETEAGAPVLAATFAGRAQPVTTRALASCLLRFPLLTWKIIAGIHFEALKLWMKGAPFYRSPPPPG